MNKPITTPIRGEEHWTNKGDDVRLFLWNKAADPSGPAGTILFVHGSSMASTPTFDLQVPGRSDSSAMDYFAARGFDTWCVDMEGYGKSTKTRDNNAPISYGADDCFAAATYIQKLRGNTPLLVYGISSGALRAALFAQRHPEMVKRLALDAHVWTGEGSPTLADRSKRLAEFRAKNRRPIDRAFVHSIFNRDHPGTADDNVIEAFADAILKLDDSVPTGTYVDMCSNLPVCRSRADQGADHHHARAVGRHRELRRPHEVLREAAEPGQAVRGDAGHRARVDPAEELRHRVSHPPELVHAAGPGVHGALVPAPTLIRHPEVRAMRASKGDGPAVHPSRAASRPPQVTDQDCPIAAMKDHMTPTEKANLELAYEHFAAESAHDTERTLKTLSDDVMYRVVASGAIVYGKEAVSKYYDVWWTAFPDVNIEIKRIVATGEWVFAENFVTATHLGPWLGIPPTGKRTVPAPVRGDPLPRRADDRGDGVLRPARAAAPDRRAVHARRAQARRAGVEGSKLVRGSPSWTLSAVCRPEAAVGIVAPARTDARISHPRGVGAPNHMTDAATALCPPISTKLRFRGCTSLCARIGVCGSLRIG